MTMFIPYTKFLVFITALVMSGNLHAGLLDSGFTAQYEVSKNDMYLGVATRTLQRTEPSNLLLTSHTVPQGFVALFVSDEITEKSRLKLKNGQFTPQLYTYTQTGGKKEKRYRLQYNWETKRMLSTYDNKKHALNPGSQELLGFQLQLMLDLQNGKREVVYDIANRKGIDRYTLTYKGDEKIETELGKINTVKIESNVTKKGRRYILWCAEKFNFLPVMVKQVEDDGDEVVLLLKNIKL